MLRNFISPIKMGNLVVFPQINCCSNNTIMLFVCCCCCRQRRSCALTWLTGGHLTASVWPSSPSTTRWCPTCCCPSSPATATPEGCSTPTPRWACCKALWEMWSRRGTLERENTSLSFGFSVYSYLLNHFTAEGIRIIYFLI